MKTGLTIICCFLTTLLLSCDAGQELQSKNGFAVIPAAGPGEAIATYAGGCFWALQECMVELKGVKKVVSGYAGGHTLNPKYDEVLAKNTGHAEAVQVYYDPKVISFEQLTTAFFYAHDPTEVDRQGPDVGSDYRSIAFFRSPGEFYIIRKLIEKIDVTNGYSRPVVTELLPYQIIYGAEMEHQDYYKKHPWNGYILSVSKPKVLNLRKNMPGLIKDQYTNQR